MTPREWLVQQGLAKPGRGKFSNEAKAALKNAMDSGMEFDSVSGTDSGTKTGTGNAVKVEPVEKVDPSSYNPADVRKWAKSQGIEVAARGRVNSDLVRQYLDSVDDAPKRSTEPGTAGSVKDIRDAMPRHRMADLWKAEGLSIKKTYKDCCNGCGWSIGWCMCQTGPVAFADDCVTLVSLIPA